MARILSEEQVEGRASSKMGRLYQSLREGRQEQEVVVAVYGDGTTVKAAKYRMLKSRLKKVMLNSLLVAETLSEKYGSYDEAYETGTRQLGLARLLLMRRAYRIGEEVALNAYRQVQKYEIFVLNEGYTDLLTALYVGILRNPALFKKYRKEHEYYVRCNQAYNKLVTKYRDFMDELYKHVLSPEEIGSLALRYYQEEESLLTEYPKAPLIQGTVRILQVYGLRLKGDYQKALLALQVMESALLRCVGVSHFVIQQVIISKVSCLLHLRDFDKGREVIEASSQFIPKGTLNEIKIIEFAVLLGLQTGNYEYAYTEFFGVKPKLFSVLPNKRVAELWLIYEAYLHLLAIAGEIDSELPIMKGEQFDPNSFFYDVPSYVANKRGLNIQIIVVQAMYFLFLDEREVFVTRTESLAKYCSRYLKDNDEIRHNCFFKLLIEVEKSGFELELRRRRIITILERMTSPTAQEISRRTNTEIIPYEVLWNLIVDHLSCTDEQLRAPAAPGSV